MDKYEYYFDIPSLLRMGDLDIRKVARNNLTLRIKDYFNLLSTYIVDEPKTTDTLKRIIAIKGEDYDFNCGFAFSAGLQWGFLNMYKMTAERKLLYTDSGLKTSQTSKTFFVTLGYNF